MTTTINSGWLFQKGDVEIDPEEPDLEEWTRVNLPHTWNNEDAFDEEDGFYQGPGWYAKVLNVPANWRNKEVFINFEGANQETAVYLNGQLIGEHIGGYTAFRFNLSPYLKFGEPNLLTVRVTNAHNEDIPPLRMDFTFFGGIYRNVSLIVADPVHFDLGNHASEGVFTRINTVSHEKADISLYGKIVNAHKRNRSIRLETKITDREQNIVVSDSRELRLSADQVVDFESGNMVIRNPSLWSPDNPYLYTVITRIYSRGNNEALLDEVVLPLGL
ncbi:MAG TPA: beta galactosidase jelly roll domain-containing protein, partial [Oceanipulchritudo sp.]|nr:beta galactosidase jelly roll domain-containing protein [Oceanipulchritudo sp.]